MKKIKNLKEVSTNTDITKAQDNPLLKSIKEFFKKEKEIEFVNYDSAGDIVTIDLRFKFNPEDIKDQSKIDPTLRVAARQQVYDVKRKLEEYLFKNFNISVLSIQGLILKTDVIEFEISFVYKNVGNIKAEYNESNSFINCKNQLIKEGSICYYNTIKFEIESIKNESVSFIVEGKRGTGAVSVLKNVLVLK